MPQVVAFAKAAWAAWSAWAAEHVIAAAIIKIAATVALSYAVGRLLAPKLSNGLNSGSPLQMSRDPVAPRRVIYGETRVSGPLLLAHVSGPKNEFLHLVIALAGHECDSIGDVLLNDLVVALDGSGNPTGTLAGFARIKKLLGSDTQTADPDLVAEASLWTTDHRLRGIAHLYARLKFDQEKWPSGIPNISAVVKGRKVYDPRTTATGWSNNPALCVRDYLTNTSFGLGVDTADIDDASFIAAANICDEAVALAAGGTEKRYTCNGSFELNAEPAVVLERLCGSMAGSVIYVGGKWVCLAGAHQVPTITLDESDLRAPITVQTKASLRDTCNRVKGTFSSPDEKWQPTDFTPQVNATYLAEDGGIEIWRDLELSFTTSHATAQRIAKIELERTRQDITVRMPCKLTALRVQAGDVVKVSNAKWGWVEKQFIVAALKFSTYDESGNIALGVDLELRETAAAVWDWNSGLETTYDPAPNTTLIAPSTVAQPGAPTLATSNFIQKDGTITPRLRATWSAPNDQFILSGGITELEYKKTSDSTWLVWNPALRGDATEDFITDVQGGVSYDVRLRWRNRFGVPGAYSNTATAIVSTDTTAPSAPTGLLALSTPGSIHVDWNPNDKTVDPDFDEFILYRNSSNNPSTAVEIWRGKASAYTDFNAGTGTKYYWATKVDTSGNESAKSTGVSGAANPATGNKFVYVFKRAASAPSTPTGNGIPSGWFDVPPAADGNPLWVSVAEQTSTGVLVGSWSAPVRLDGAPGAPGATGATGATGAAGADGADGDSIYVEYSVDGSTSWHSTFTTGDIYMRVKTGVGGTWSAAIKITGELEDGEVTTAKVANGAITTTSAAYSSGGTTLTGSTWVTIQDVYLTTTGEAVLVKGGHKVSNSGFWFTGIPIGTPFAGYTQAPAFLRILRDGSTVVTEGYFECSGLDTPGAGFTHYELQAYSNMGTGPQSYNRSLTCSELKR